VRISFAGAAGRRVRIRAAPFVCSALRPRRPRGG
jgi:hypothetical protein